MVKIALSSQVYHCTVKGGGGGSAEFEPKVNVCGLSQSVRDVSSNSLPDSPVHCKLLQLTFVLIWAGSTRLALWNRMVPYGPYGLV